MDLFLMGRPWLEINEFNTQMSDLTESLEEQIEKEISISTKLSVKSKHRDYFSDRANKLKNYEYKNINIDNYGDPVLDKNNNLIGYKLNNSEYASILTYYNDDNLLCNKIYIQEFDVVNLSFKNEVVTT
jgi:hypothetical protein